MPRDSDPTSASDISRARREGRVVHGEESVWRVYELVQRFDRRHGPVLVFESDTVMRTVRDFPSDWRTLHDDELIQLSWRR